VGAIDPAIEVIDLAGGLLLGHRAAELQVMGRE
jgi:hypothetical protein